MDKGEMPKVSVVMPTYNRADLLPDVVQSILGQEYRNFELLIVDDGSTDHTDQVVYSIQEGDSRVRYHKLPANKGLGFARQAGLELAHGQYIALADHDDIWMPGKLQAQVNALEAHPDIDILFADFRNINHIAGTEAGGFDEARRGFNHLSSHQIGSGLWVVDSGFEIGILDLDFIAPSTMMIRSSVISKVGGFNPNLMATDHEFDFRAAALGAKFAYHNCPMIYRHVYPSSISQRPIKAYLEVLDALAACRQVCEKSQKMDLIKHVDFAAYRTYIQLMYGYGQAGQRSQAWTSYRKSLAYNFHIKDLVLLLVCLSGAWGVSWFERARKAESKWFKKDQ